MTERPKEVVGDEITGSGLAVGLVVLVPGALLLGLLPFMSAMNRLGYVGATLLLLAIVMFSLAFFPAYEHFKPSSPPTPRRDLIVIVFSGMLIGLWTFAFTNEVVAVLVLGTVGAIVLLPDDWRQRFADHLPQR